MNQTLEAIRDRFSCRAFTGAMPTDEQIEAIAQAAIQAPSGMNNQPWQVIVVRDADLIAELEAEGTRVMNAMEDQSLAQRIRSRGGRLFYNAPCVIYVPMQEDGAMDCGIVCQTIALAAQSLGLGSCICGLAALSFATDNADHFKQRLGFAEGYDFGCAVLIGEAAGPGTPHPPQQGKLTFIG